MLQTFPASSAIPQSDACHIFECLSGFILPEELITEDNMKLIAIAVFAALLSACSAVESTGEAVDSTGRAIGSAGSAVGRGAGDIVSGVGTAVERGAVRTEQKGY